MNRSEFDKLKETSWRRRLTAREESALNEFFASDGEERLRWEDETALNELLAKLPDAPVSTNFTARVFQLVERESSDRVRAEHGILDWFRFNWIPRIAVAVLLLGVGTVSLQEHRRAEIARDVAAVSNVASVPPQWLQDFDAINRLSQPPIDNELLAALQ